MIFTFLFWLTAFYTLVMFGLQIVELLTGQAPFNFMAINAGYLGLMSVYVGGKEVGRWHRAASPETVVPGFQAVPPSRPSFRVPGEWFVGAWVVFFLGASLLVQFGPGRFTYPTGLNTIALEVLGFYIGSSVSRWLNIRKVETQAELEKELTEGPAPAPIKPGLAKRVTKRRQGLEAKVMDAARKKGGVTREDVEKITGLKTSAAAALLSSMVELGLLRRTGGSGDTQTRYEASGL